MYTLVSQRLNEGQSGPTFYPTTEIIRSLNEAERFFCLLTLCLETTQAWVIPANTTYFHMLGYFSNWIVPLRMTNAATGAKIRPSRQEDLGALNAQWIASPGTKPLYYTVLGADLVGIYPQPTALFTANVTYARAPVALANDTDVPEIPVEYHPRLVDYAIYRMRQVEGSQEFQKVIPLYNDFLEAAQRYAAYVRSRNLGSRYDKVPPEDEFFERSKLLKARRDLVPAKKPDAA